MFDSNNREIRTGDFLTVSGAYFKNNNGLYLVTSAADTPNCYGNSVWMHRVKKSGELAVSRAGSTLSLPLGYYCSDSRKNRAAKEHDAQNLRYEVTEGVNPYYAAAHFREQAEKYRAMAETQRRRLNETDAEKSQALADFYAATADRLAEKSEPPHEKSHQTGIRFYWNGIKVDGGRLIPCFYSLDENSVTISARDYKDLPAQYFTVVNRSDPYSDYCDSDRATLTAEHPLYKYAFYAAWKNRVKDLPRYIENQRGRLTGRETWPGHFDSLRRDIAQREQWLAEFAAMPDPGQPTAADLQAVEELKTAAESARLAAQHAAELAEREQTLKMIHEGRVFIEQTAARYPVTEGAPTVEIGFSESPYLYSLSHGLNNIFSVAAAEIILRHYDVQTAAPVGRDAHIAADAPHREEKTDFIVRCTDPETGEENTYEGRYDLGDGDGGLIEHIRAYGRWYRTHDEHTGKEIENPPAELSDAERLADFLEQYTAGGKVVRVELAPGVIDFLAYRKKKEQDTPSRGPGCPHPGISPAAPDNRRPSAFPADEQPDDDAPSIQDLYDAVSMLTDEQLAAAVYCIDPQDKTKIDVARFFLQELNRRDGKMALEVFRKWKTGQGA